MPRRQAQPTRITRDIVDAAASIAPTVDRSAAEQINHWARVGMHVERSTSIDQRRILQVVAGNAQFRDLNEVERAAAHANIDARIADRIAKASFGARARAEGNRTVSIDDDGNLIEIAADGTVKAL